MKTKNISAREYWKDKFDEYPKTDADKIAVAMMSEYATQQLSIEREKAEADMKVLGKAIELITYFVNRVENGTIKSKTTYAIYKGFLNGLNEPKPEKP